MNKFRTFFIGLTACALLLPVSSASAMTFGGGEEYILPESENVNDDLYIGAANAVINGQVIGDLMISGGNVTIANRVENDLTAAGGNVTISGEVGDDLRVAGGSVVILKNVGDDLLAAGGTVHILKDVVIGGDLTVAGGLVIIDGTVNGNLKVAGGEISLNGTVNGDVNIIADDVLKIGPGANVSKRIIYEGPREAAVSEAANLVNGITFTKLERNEVRINKERSKIYGATFAGLLGAAWLLQALMFLTAALFAVYGLKKFSGKLVDTAMKAPGKSILHGFGFLILTPIALFILAATVFGIPLAIIGGMSYALMIAIAKIFAGILLGAWIFTFASKEKVVLDWKIALVGVFAIEILTLIPFIGWLAAFLIFCTALGAVYEGVMKRIKEAR